VRIALIYLSRHATVAPRVLDVAAGLAALGHEVAAITHPKARLNARLAPLPISQLSLSAPLGERDARAAAQLGPLVRTLRAEIVLCFDGLTMMLARRALGAEKPIVAMADAAPYAWAAAADLVLTAHLYTFPAINEAGVALDRLHYLPPMIAQRGGFIRPVWQQPPVMLLDTVPGEAGGIDLFLQAMAQVKEQGFDCRARIVGAGWRMLALRRQAARLGLQGTIEIIAPEQREEALKNADIYIYPLREGLACEGLLAPMAAKLPILATQLPCVAELLQTGEEAVLVTPGDAEALAQGLVYLLKDEDRARTLASNAFHRLKRQYARERVCQALAAQLAEMVASHIPQARVREVA
jgi:hypothetical protein